MRLLLITLLTVGRLCESANAFEWKNSLPNTSNSCAINFKDTAMYQQGEPVVLSAKDGSSVRVFKVVNGISQTVTNGAFLNIPNLPVGYYFLESSNDRAGLVVLPKNWHPASWFGTETLANVDWNWPISRVYTQLQASVKRGGEAAWFRIQTNDVDNPARWDWRWADDAVNHIGSKAAVNICGAYASPVYATNPATFFRGWTNYVTAVFTRYKNLADAGRLYFEVWNEPMIESVDPWQFPYRLNAGSPFPAGDRAGAWTNWANYYSDLVATTEMVRVKLKSKSKLVGPSTCNLEDYISLMDVLARRGQLKNLSAVSFHDYWTEILPADFSDVPWNVRPGKTAWSMLKDARKIIGNKPIWVDEFAMPGRSAITDARYTRTGPDYNSDVMDWRTAQNRSMKQVLVYLANGVTLIIPHVFYRQPDEGDFESGIDLYGWECGLRGIKPKTAAFLMLAHLTDGYESIGMKMVTGNHCTTLFSKGTTYRVFMWSKEGATQAVTTPARLKDLYGNLLPEGVLPDEVCYYDISVRDTAPLLLENLP